MKLLNTSYRTINKLYVMKKSPTNSLINDLYLVNY